MNEARKPVVVVAGGGYSGVLAANRVHGQLAGEGRVILVAPAHALTDRIRLHEVAVRGGDARRPYTKQLARGVQHVRGLVVGLDPEAGEIVFERAEAVERLRYDALILALGSHLRPAIPSTAPHGEALCDIEHAQQLAAALPKLADGEPVTVVGGGLSAIELSAELADAYPRLRVELIACEFAQGLEGPIRDALRAGLVALGVHLREGVRVIGLSADEVLLEDGSRLPTKVGILASGFVATPLGPGFLLPTRDDGRIAVDEQLRVPGLPNVFVAGDLAAPPSAAIGTGLSTTRMACATAMPLGAHAADQVVRMLHGKPLLPYRFGYALQCISLGRKDGVVAFVDTDDRPSGRIIRGRPAALIKESICRVVIGSLRLERWRAGIYAWPRARRTRDNATAEQLQA
jgi:NADH dehydrogenase FAD-containing subunit